MRIRSIAFFIAVCIIPKAEAASADRSQTILTAMCQRLIDLKINIDEKTRSDCAPYLVRSTAARSPRAAAQNELSAETTARAQAVVPDKPANASPSDDIPGTKRLFIRADPIDNYFYGVGSPVDTTLVTAKGASLSYTNDRNAHTQQAMLSGLVSYLLIPPRASDFDKGGDYALAAWVSASGTWQEPLKKPDGTAYKVGLDGQARLRLQDPFFPTQIHHRWDNYFNVRPYLQTDSRQKEHAGGVNIAWEPVIPELLLGQGRSNRYVAAFWSLRPEVDFRRVGDPGNTNQIAGSYAWLGYTARATALLLPYASSSNAWVNEYLVNRFTVIGTAQYFWDARSQTNVRGYSLQLSYNLGPCTFPKQSDPGVYPDCKITGNAALSFEYDWGRDKDTLVDTNQYIAKLSYKY